MGKPMVKNLLKAGHKVTVYDIVPAGMDDVASAGAEKGSSPKDVAGKTDIIITMVPDGPEGAQAVFGPNGVLEGAKQGSTVIDMSSISPMVSQKVGAALEAKGIDFLDAPVSGGEPKAIEGALANPVKPGLAGSTLRNVKAPMVYPPNFKPGFRIRLHQKDLRNALLAAESMKVSLPLTSTVQNMLIDLMNNGKGDLDHSALVQVI